MFAIRAMAPRDLDAVLKLTDETPEAPRWDRAVWEDIVASVDQRTAVRKGFIAANRLDLLGFAAAHLVAGVCELESIAVAKSARRTGIGSALLNAVAGWALARGARKLELEVRAANASAIAFYERAGLLNEGLRPGYYHDPQDDAALMGKSLYSND
ncbi:MAG: GNAT family N-acetyltransferase [Silvibacterium sp.]|nr:GNAT family N-acetyltransferase [Silvibacterium sp.]